MTSEQLHDCYINALDWVNKVRKIDGKKPLKKLPKGKRRRITMCPLAKATGYNICGFKNPPPIDHPSIVQCFIMYFDQGKYPELIQK